MASFEYEPLYKEFETRFLVLQPDSSEAPIKCTLIHGNLSQISHPEASLPSWGVSGLKWIWKKLKIAAPEFEALSYTWGDTTSRKIITVNGLDFEIAENLEIILRFLRNGEGEEERVLWIDAICINQSDDEEKSWQVARMRTIYAQAKRVVVWLGRSVEEVDQLNGLDLDGQVSTDLSQLMGELEDTEIAFRLLKGLADAWKRFFPEDLMQRAVTEHITPQVSMEQLSHEGIVIAAERIPNAEEKMKWLALGRIFLRPWFTRVWVLQEYECATDAIIMVGAHSISRPTIKAALLLLHCQLINRDAAPFILNLGIQRAIAMLLPRRFTNNPSTLPDEFLERLNITRNLAATDPRDKIFAIFKPGLLKGLRPDYTKTIQQTYTNLAVLMLQQTKHLDILCFCNGSTREGLPSWVPDWTNCLPQIEYNAFRVLRSQNNRNVEIDAKRKIPPEEAKIGEFADDFLVGGVSYPPFIGVYPKSVAEVKFSGNFTVLNVKGAIVGRISEIGSTQLAGLEDEDYFSAEMRKVLDEWYILAHRVYAQHGKQGGVELDFAKLLLKADLETNNAMIGDAIALMKAWAYFLTLKGEKREEITLYQRQYMTDVARKNCGCALFTMMDGKTGLTIAAHGAMIGDLIAVLKGGQMPFILRPEGEGFRLVGRCYVQGLMCGEAAEGIESGEYELETLSLI